MVVPQRQHKVTPPSKVVERFVDSPFWQSCGIFFKILSLSKVVEKIMKVVENFLWSKRKLWKIESCGNFPQLSYLFSTTLICIFHNFRIFGLKSPKFSPAALHYKNPSVNMYKYTQIWKFSRLRRASPYLQGRFYLTNERCMRKILWFLAVHSGFYLRKITPQAKILSFLALTKSILPYKMSARRRRKFCSFIVLQGGFCLAK